MIGHGRRYLRAKAEISAGKDGDISGQGRGYPPQCRVTGRQDKAYIDLNSANGYRLGRVKAIIHVLLYVLGKSVVWRFRNVDGLLLNRQNAFREFLYGLIMGRNGQSLRASYVSTLQETLKNVKRTFLIYPTLLLNLEKRKYHEKDDEAYRYVASLHGIGHRDSPGLAVRRSGWHSRHAASRHVHRRSERCHGRDDYRCICSSERYVQWCHYGHRRQLPVAQREAGRH